MIFATILCESIHLLIYQPFGGTDNTYLLVVVLNDTRFSIHYYQGQVVAMGYLRSFYQSSNLAVEKFGGRVAEIVSNLYQFLHFVSLRTHEIHCIAITFAQEIQLFVCIYLPTQ